MSYNDPQSRVRDFDPTQTTFVFFQNAVPKERIWPFWPFIVAGTVLLACDWFLFRYLCPDIHVGEVFVLFLCSVAAGTFVVEAISKLLK